VERSQFRCAVHLFGPCLPDRVRPCHSLTELKNMKTCFCKLYATIGLILGLVVSTSFADKYSVAVQPTQLFLATLAAFRLPNDVKDCTMKFEGHTSTITKTITNNTVTVVVTLRDETTKYSFRGSRVELSDMLVDPNDGKVHEATGSYDLMKEFGFSDPNQLAKAAEAVLRAKGKSLTMKLESGENSLSVSQVSGDAPGVLGRLHKRFEPAKFKWK